MKKLLLAAAFVSLAVLFAGCPENGGGGVNCPAADQGETFCGYCDPDDTYSGDPHADKCRYCPQGYYCDSDTCASPLCHSSPSGGSSGSGTTGGGGSSTQKVYYCSCSQCQGYYPSYSYRGTSYGECNGWYQVCVSMRCGKILDNCR